MFNVNIAHIRELLKEVPPDDRPKDERDFWLAVAMELGWCLEYASKAECPQVTFGGIQKRGEQYICEFAVSDTVRPSKNEFNWHGQNTSQWLYAGCVLIHNKKVSTHH